MKKLKRSYPEDVKSHRDKMKFLFEQSDRKMNPNFQFPESGWSCGACRNYNFSGREICNRCNKQKDQGDTDGLPPHLARHNVKKDELRQDAMAGK